MRMIALIDYGRGNLASVANALLHLKADFQVTSCAEDLLKSDAVILPGVGAFDDAARALRAQQLDSALRRFASEGKPFLGICLGMQLLFERSDEGNEKGLGLLEGEVLSFEKALGEDKRTKIPHMGWNSLFSCTDPYLRDKSELYFVHSYFVKPQDPRVSSAFCHYAMDFTAAVLQANLRGYQFHPEKSGSVGLSILEAFLNDMGKTK